jgi:hypothetical protein
MRWQPTGVSAETKSLFFWDEVTTQERVAWMNTSTGVFDTFVDLGNLEMAAPNLLCIRINCSAAGASSTLDLFFAAAR